MAAFTIPTIFTAIDKLSAPLRGMGRNVESFANKFEAGIARSERTFNKLTPALSEASKQFLSFASTAAIAAGIIGGIYFSFDALKEYETAMHSLQATTGVTDKVFEGFKSEISSVAKETKMSSIDVARAFEIIGSEQPALLENAAALGDMTKAVSMLSKASRMEMEPATISLTTALNQFKKGSDYAATAVDMLAAGNVAGSSTIVQTTDALAKFGTVAANTGTKLNESIALIELVSPFEKGAEAGTKLRNVLQNMSAAKILDKSALADMKRLGVNLDIVTNSALPLNTRLKEMSKIAGDSNAIMHVFGKENSAIGTAVLTNAGSFQAMLDAVNKTGFAEKQAAKNTDTLSVAIKEAQNSYVNLLTSNEQLGSGLSALKNVMRFVARNMETIVTIGFTIISVFLVWKAVLIASQISLAAYNIILGITGALSNTASIAIGRNAIALGAYNVVTKIVTASQWLWNAAMAANPIGLIIIAIVALIALVVVIIKYWNEWGAALSLFLGPLGMIISLIQSFRRNWDMIKKSFTEGGILEGLKAIGATILDSLLMPMQQLMKIVGDLTGADWAKGAASSIEAFRKELGVNVETDESGNPLPSKELLNPKAVEQDALTSRMESTQKQNVSIAIADKTGRAEMESDNNFIPIKLSSTQGF